MDSVGNYADKEVRKVNIEKIYNFSAAKIAQKLSTTVFFM